MTPKRIAIRFAACLLASLALGNAWPQQLLTTVAANASPGTLLVNPVTNKIYVINTCCSLQVMDGTTHAMTTIGNTPPGVPQPKVGAIDPVANKVYVGFNVNTSTTKNGLGVIDGATDTLTYLDAGTAPAGNLVKSIAVNPVTHKVYAARDVGEVTVFDTANANAITRVIVTSPTQVAVNAVTNRAYVGGGDGNITRINGDETIVTIPTFGSQILALAVNSVTNKIYGVALAGQVFEVDGATEVVTSITTVANLQAPQNRSSSIAINPATNKIYVSDTDGHRLRVIDGATRGLDASPATDTTPGELVVDVVANRVYVTTFSSNDVLNVVDGATNAVTQISAGQTSVTFYGLAINPVTGRVYASSTSGNTIWVIDRATYGQTPTLPTSAVAVNPVSGKVYLGGQFNGGSPADRTITVLDAATGGVLTSIFINTGLAANMQAMAVDPVLNKVYALTQFGRLVIVDGATDTVVGTPLAIGGGTKDLVVNPVTHRVYVANAGTGNVDVVDGLTNTVLPSIAAGGGSPRIALNAETNQVFAILDRPDLGPGNPRSQLAVIDGATDSLLKVVELGSNRRPTAVAVNPATNMIYVATNNAGFNSGGALEIVGSTLGDPSPTVNQLPIGVSHGSSVAVNPLTNRVFVGTASVNVWVFDPVAVTGTAVLTTHATGELVVDTVRNKVYGTQYLAAGVIEIDGATLGFKEIDLSASNGGNGSTQGPGRLAVDQTTGKVWVPCDTIGCSATVIVDPAASSLTNHRPSTALAVGVNGATSQASPNLSVTVGNDYAPSNPSVQKVYFRSADLHGVHSTATGSGPYTAAVTGLRKGINYVSLFALDAMAGTSSSGKYGNSGATPGLTGAPRVFAFAYTGPPAVATASLPNGKVPNAYSQVLASSGGIGTYSYAVTAGALPNGLSLSAAGAITGPPSVAGTFNFTVTVTDGLGTTGTKGLSITIAPADAALALTPSTTKDFGSIVVGGSSGGSAVTVTNTGGGTLNVGAPAISGTHAGDFGITSNNCGALAPNATCTMDVAFSPSAAGARAAVLTVPNDGAGTTDNQVNLTGTGIAQDTTPDAFSFTDVTLVARGSTQTSNPVTISGINFPAAISVTGGSYSIGCTATFVTSPSTIANGQTVCVRHAASGLHSTATDTTLTVGGVSDTFSSTTLAGFTITAAAAGPGTGTITGTGFNCPGDCSEKLDSGTQVTLTANAAGGSAFTSWAGCNSAAGNQCTVTASADKTVTATFSVAAAPAVSLSTPALAFGGQSMGTTSPAMPVTVTNTGSASLTVSNVSIDNAQFAQTNNCTSVAPTASCTVNVTFSPSAAAGAVNSTSAVSGNVSITTNAAGSPHVVTLSGSGEKSLVTHYYRSILRRAPDGGGKAYWQGEAQRLKDLGANVNETWFAMAQFFYFSAEYTALNRDNTGFVTDLYVTFFNRAPDGGGLSFWTGLLGQGMPREVVLAAFMFSTEFVTFTQNIFGNTAARAEVDVVMDFYRGLLSRTPDQGGFDSWVGQFRAAQCAGAGAVTTRVEDISSNFANGGEYVARNRTNAQFVGDLYNAFLRRGGDLTGVQFWITTLDTQSRSYVRQQFIASSEFQGRVANIVNQGCLP